MKRYITLFLFALGTYCVSIGQDLGPQELTPQEQVVYDFIMDMGQNKDLKVKTGLLDVVFK